MAVIQMAQVRKEREKQVVQAARIRRRYAFRYLRDSKIYVAMFMHHCDYCICPIMPGDQYVKEIWRNDLHFKTKRKHWPDCTAPTEDEHYEELDRLERESDAEAQQERKSA